MRLSSSGGGTVSVDGSTITGTGASGSPLTAHYQIIVQLLSSGNPLVDIVSSTTETTLISTSVPANSLGISGRLHFKLNLTVINTGSNNTTSFRVKFGGTTLLTLAPLNGAGANPNTAIVEGDIFNLGVTNKQYCSATYIQGQGAADGTATSMLSGLLQIAQNQGGVIDTTSAAILAITAQQSLNSAGCETKLYGALVERFGTSFV